MLNSAQTERPIRPLSTPESAATPRRAASPLPPPATPTPAAQTDAAVIGLSAQGRPITVRQVGEGALRLVLIGGIHGGWEANTVALIEALSEHFTRTPEDALPGISLLLVPLANPDGFARGRAATARFNAGGVDLNRNWGCGWSPEAVWRDQPVDPGASAFSEPETRALAGWIRETRPAAVLFYHSAAGGVFAGDCGDAQDSLTLAAVYGSASGYAFGQPFDAYPVSGTAPSWVAGLGIPSVDIELFTKTETEFARNLRGVMAVQCWLLHGRDQCA